MVMVTVKVRIVSQSETEFMSIQTTFTTFFLPSCLSFFFFFFFQTAFLEKQTTNRLFYSLVCSLFISLTGVRYPYFSPSWRECRFELQKAAYIIWHVWRHFDVADSGWLIVILQAVIGQFRLGYGHGHSQGPNCQPIRNRVHVYTDYLYYYLKLCYITNGKRLSVHYWVLDALGRLAKHSRG